MSEERWVEQAEMLGNRLRKNEKRLRKWSRREKVSCYRLYDRDIPEIPLVIDWYEGRLHIAAFSRRKREDEEESALVRWEQILLEAVSDALGLAPEFVFVKRRERQKGSQQYTHFASEGQRFVVEESGHKFWVNLSDYLDTGLFLDHRPTRQRVQSEANGKRFLNLFSYTGAFTVYAHAGGASEMTTVDLSKTYIGWARENLELNGFDLSRHHLQHADVFSFLREPARDRERYDLVVVDPPTFSNSKRMQGTLDIQRDHVWMLNRVLELMSPGGVIYFSNNFRKFQLEGEQLNSDLIEDISGQSIPYDFKDKLIHRCWKITRSA